MTEKQKNKGLSELAKLAIYIGIVAIGWLMPAMAGITEIGMRLIFVFIAAVFAWSVSSELWPSLLSFVMIPLTGVISFKDFIASGWGTETILFIVLIFVLIRFMEEQGVSRFIAAWMLKRKFLKGHPWRTVFMILLVAYLICSLINIFVGIFLVWGIVYSISKSLGFKPYDKFPTIVLFGVAVMGALSLTAMPWGTNSIVLLAFFENLLGQPLDIAKFITFTVPYGLTVIAAYLLLCKFVFRLDVSTLKNMDDSFINEADLELTPVKKIALGTLLVFVTALLLPSFLPKDLALAKLLSSMGYVGITLVIFVILSIVKVDNKNIFDFAQLASKGISWNIVLMTVVIIPIGICLTNEATGITAFISKTMLPIFDGMSPIVFLLAIVALTVVLTNVLANMPVAMILMPVAVSVSNSYGIAAEQIGYLIIAACAIAFFTPAASPAGLLLFSNKDWLRPADIYKYGSPTIIVVSILSLLVNYFWLGLFY